MSVDGHIHVRNVCAPEVYEYNTYRRGKVMFINIEVLAIQWENYRSTSWYLIENSNHAPLSPQQTYMLGFIINFESINIFYVKKEKIPIRISRFSENPFLFIK
jgi:hypothetical protein